VLLCSRSSTNTTSFFTISNSAGVRSRLAGYVLAFCELLVLVLPFPILSYVPNFFFGSLLVMICIDLMHEWLWHVRVKVTGAEYGICLVTFILIQCLGVEYGIIVGVIMYVLCGKLGLDVGEQKGGDPLTSEKIITLTDAPQQKPVYGST
jgi:MFS superfamily sulfate permease-like transporter